MNRSWAVRVTNVSKELSIIGCGSDLESRCRPLQVTVKHDVIPISAGLSDSVQRDDRVAKEPPDKKHLCRALLVLQRDEVHLRPSPLCEVNPAVANCL